MKNNFVKLFALAAIVGVSLGVCGARLEADNIIHVPGETSGDSVPILVTGTVAEITHMSVNWTSSFVVPRTDARTSMRLLDLTLSDNSSDGYAVTLAGSAESIFANPNDPNGASLGYKALLVNLSSDMAFGGAAFAGIASGEEGFVAMTDIGDVHQIVNATPSVGTNEAKASLYISLDVNGSTLLAGNYEETFTVSYTD